MKHYSIIVASAAFFAIILSSCKDSDPTPEPARETATLEQVIPANFIDSLVKKGMKINRGDTPPTLNGIFNMSPVVVTANAGRGDDFSVGQIINDYRFEFSDQNTSNNSVRLRYKSLPSQDQASSIGGYIIGSGNFFSVYSENKGKTLNVDYVSVTLLSGEITKDGIKNMQLAFFLKSKGDDPGHRMMDVGKIRVFGDSDQLSKSGTTYRLSGEPLARVLETLGSR